MRKSYILRYTLDIVIKDTGAQRNITSLHLAPFQGSRGKWSLGDGGNLPSGDSFSLSEKEAIFFIFLNFTDLMVNQRSQTKCVHVVCCLLYDGQEKVTLNYGSRSQILLFDLGESTRESSGVVVIISIVIASPIYTYVKLTELYIRDLCSLVCILPQ